MNEPGKVMCATALSAAGHCCLFAALALLPGAAAVSVITPPRDEPLPLEVVIMESAPEPEIVLPHPDALRTELDPENLQSSEQPPEEPIALAAHDSQAAPDLEIAPAGTEELGIDALGHYGKAVANAIGARWERLRQQTALAVGVVRLQFTLDAEGRASGIRVLANSAAEANAAVAIRAVQEAKIPPIPPERLAQLPDNRAEIVYSFTNY